MDPVVANRLLREELELVKDDLIDLADAAREILQSGIELDDPRMRYMVVQIDRDAWADLADSLPKDPA